MVKRVDALEAKAMIEAGVAVVDVLPAAVFQEEHLPGAQSLPLDTFQTSDAAQLDRAAPLLVYCFDQH